MTDITEGINKVLMGPQKKSTLVTPDDRKLTAYHESGHAILGKLLKNCEEVQEVSIIPRGMAGGYTLSRPENDNSYTSYGKLMDQIAMSMGGRIAEELIMGDITTGASSDIQHATSIAHKMVFDWGMSSKLGFMSLDSNSQVFIGRDYQTRNAFSEKIVADADDEVRTILAQNYKRAKAILTDNMKLLHEMAGLLLERETIYKEEVDMLVGGKTKEEIIKILSEREKAQKEKESKIIESNKKQAEIDALRKKILEGERLLAANVISKEEYEMLVQDLQAREEALKKEKEEQKNTQETKKETAELVENKEEKSEEKKTRRIKKSKDEGDTNE